MQIRYSRSAAIALRRSAKALLLRSKIEQLADDPDSLSANIKRLKGGDNFRLRVQDVRVLFRIVNGILEIDDIRPRRDAYRR